MKKVFALVGVLAVAACASPEEKAAIASALSNAQAACEGGNQTACADLMMYHQHKEDQRRAAAAAMSEAVDDWNRDMQMRNMQMQQNIALQNAMRQPVRLQTHCTGYGYTVNCW